MGHHLEAINHMLEAHIPLAHTKVVKEVYVAMLKYLSMDEIIHFFKSASLLRKGKAVFLSETLHYIWKSKDFVSYRKVAQFVNALEKYCLKYNKQLKLGSIEGGFIGNSFSNWLIKSVSRILKSPDPRHFLASELMEEGNRNVFKNIVHTYFCQGKKDNQYRGYSVLINDPTFSGRIPAVNVRKWIMPRLKRSPILIGFPPFEHVECLIEEREIADILPNTISNDKNLFYKDTLIAEKSSLYSFFDQNEINYKSLAIPDTTGYIALRDMRAPNQDILLKKGTFYGAKISLFTFCFTEVNALNNSDEHMLDEFFDEAEQVKHKHTELIKHLRKDEEMIFSFWEEEKKILLNHKVLTKGIQAEILRYVLEEFHQKERTDFHFNEFCSDNTFPYIQKSSSFVNRLHRIISILDKHDAPIKIHKTDKGMFSIHPLKDFTYNRNKKRLPQ